MPAPLPHHVIETDQSFYGYLVELCVEAACPEFQTPQRMLATFEFHGEQQTWEVPSCALFEKLWQYLYGHALRHFQHGSYGYDKASIWQSKDGEWHVEVPAPRQVPKARKVVARKRKGVQRLQPLAHGVRGRRASPRKKKSG